MSERTNNENASEEQLAQRLEKLHQALLESRRNSTNETPAGNANKIDGELQPAADLLKLLDQIKPVGGDPDDELPTVGPVTDSMAETEVELSSWLSRFDIIKPRGQGGYGTVFLARDVNLNRNVALKFPRPEVLTRPGLKQRFIHEARAASSLSHPNIVTVYEAGKDGGLYFIACEYVRGKTLDDYLKEQNEPISANAAADMIAVLALAIAHAHDRGIVHRDLKPSNILIDLGVDPEPANQDSITANSIASRLKIADFGLSKTIESDSQQTRTGAIVGTPAYMAPEQTHGDAGQVGHSVDIYALGTILYRFLTGTIPFERSTVLKTVRAVQEQEPTSPRKLNSLIPADLESICLKCLEKNPLLRYESAFALADDLKQFRSGFPVHARPVKRTDRMIRWAKRNPVLTIVGSLAAMFLLAALTASLIGWSTTRGALIREQVAKSESDQRYRDIKKAIDTYFTKVCENPRFQRLPQTEPIRQELLRMALTYYQQFAEENSDDSDLAMDVARVQIRMGEVFADLGMQSNSLTQFHLALETIDQQMEFDSDNLEQLGTRTRALNGAAMANLALGDSDTALTLSAQAIDNQTRLLGALPGDLIVARNHARYQSNRSRILALQNNYPDALSAMLPVVASYMELAAGHPEDTELEFKVADSMVKVGDLLARVGKTSEAESQFNRSIVKLKDLTHRDPTLWAASESLVAALENKAKIRMMQRDSEQAETLFLETLPIVETLTRVHPTHVNYLLRKASVTGNLANIYMQRKLVDKARPLYKKAMEVSHRIVEIDPHAADGIRAVASNSMSYGSFLSDADDDFERAESQFRQSREHWRRLESSTQDTLQTQLGLSGCAINLSHVVWKAKKSLDESLLYANEAIEILERQSEAFPKNPIIKFYSSNAYGQRALVLRELVRFEESIADSRKRLELVPPPRIPETQINLALTLMMNDEFDESLKLMSAVENTIEDSPPHARGNLHYRLAECHALLAGRAQSRDSSKSEGNKFAIESEKALQHLVQALETDAGVKTFRRHDDEVWDSIRQLKQFKKLAAKAMTGDN